jgi:hypothetical protein
MGPPLQNVCAVRKMCRMSAMIFSRVVFIDAAMVVCACTARCKYLTKPRSVEETAVPITRRCACNMCRKGETCCTIVGTLLH